jgi:nickel/cobalt transporter (NicO) family protein
MTQEIWLLAGTAASIGFIHTVIGPDHYLPFIFMSKARKWSIAKTSWITVACGIGHVGSSILLGFLGIAFGVALGKLEMFEGIRGNIAAWAFVIFGFVYLIWGIRRAVINKPHHHAHYHNDGTMHTHDHTHSNSHDHEHKKNITPWILFTIFVLGPCEPLIPILMYPAAQSSLSGVILVSLLFSITTIATMLGIVLLTTFGMSFLPLGKLERYSHAMAGVIVFLSGVAILLGL